MRIRAAMNAIRSTSTLPSGRFSVVSSVTSVRMRSRRSIVFLRRLSAKRCVSQPDHIAILSNTNTCLGLPLDGWYAKLSKRWGAVRSSLSLAELRDQELMPHLLKANPHKSTFANMMLFLRYQVEDFAWKKWGTPEALDAEWQRRVDEKKKKKNKKFEEGLKELRRRTRETVWQKRKDKEHRHSFGGVEKGPDGFGKQICHECGFSIDVEEF